MLRCDNHHHHTLHRRGERCSHGGVHEEWEVVGAGATRTVDGEASSSNSGEGLPQTVPR